MTLMDSTHVWVSKDDGSDIVRADAIVGVGMDYNGHVTARLAGGEGAAVTLVAPDAAVGAQTPADFHRQLIRVVTQLADAAEAFVVRPVCDEPHGWRWISEPL
jgi:hypothetical protein